MRFTLTFAQCAGATALTILALLLTRSFIALTSLDLGWESGGVVGLHVTPPGVPGVDRPWYDYLQWTDRLIARLEATPGIARAAVTTQIPLTQQSYSAAITPYHTTGGDDLRRWTAVPHHVSDGYFSLMGTRLLRGRLFGPDDRFTEAQLTMVARAARGVAVVSRTLADTLWPGQDPIGQLLRFPDWPDTVEWREVVGVIDDMQFHDIGEPPGLHVFVPWTQQTTGNPRFLLQGSRERPLGPTDIREIVDAAEPGTRVDGVVSLDELVSRATAQPRFTTGIVAGFGVLTLILAAVGIYGTLSYSVEARTREIGVRLALGATRRKVVYTVLQQAVPAVVAGGIVGIATATMLARTFQHLLFARETMDATPFAVGVVVLLIVAMLAAIGPARRAMSVEPARTLRAE